MKANLSRDRVVYSTEQGRICPGCGNPVNQCTCLKQTSSPGDGNVRVSREIKGRKGKGVTLIKGLDMDATTLALMSKKLKVMCGSGGTVKESVIEIQGDHVERILDYLKGQGLRAKRAGGWIGNYFRIAFDVVDDDESLGDILIEVDMAVRYGFRKK